jgi:hypothetical protein
VHVPSLQHLGPAHPIPPHCSHSFEQLGAGEGVGTGVGAGEGVGTGVGEGAGVGAGPLDNLLI